MNYSCVRIEKVKTADGVRKCCDEHDRKNGFENRENINHEKTALNKSMQNWQDDNLQTFEDVFEARKKQYNETHKRALRKDAVHMLDGIFVLSDVKNSNAFAKSCSVFMREFFPNCDWKLWAHLDEKTIHIHFGVCAIDRDGQCITDKTMNKANFRKMQTRFAEICQENGLDVNRGVSKEDRYNQNLPQNYHKSPWQYANECETRAKQAEEREKRAKISEEIATKNRIQEENRTNSEIEKQKEIIAQTEDEIKLRDFLKEENAKATKELQAKSTLLKDREAIDFVSNCINMDGWEDRSR